MGTKNNPGSYDCYQKAEPDEPMFVLLGRDPTAALIVSLWISLRRELGKDDPQMLAEASDCSVEMAKWAARLGKDPRDALLALANVLQKFSRDNVSLQHLQSVAEAAGKILDQQPDTDPIAEAKTPIDP